MPTPKKKSNSSVVTVRARKTIALAPATLGFASLVEPDDYDPDKPTFKLNYHLSPEGISQLVEDIASKVYTPDALEKLKEECEANGITKIGEPQDPATWLEQKLKEPKEKARIQLPHLVIANRAFYKKGRGDEAEMVKREIACWDAKNTKLNLRKLRLGMGSTIQAVVYGNLFYSKLIGVPQPSLKLVGVRVLKLERWGGGAAPADTDEEAIREVLGEEFQYDDLAAYASGGAEEDHGEEHDLTPEDQAANLFGGGQK